MTATGPVYNLLNRRNIHWIIILIATVSKSILTAVFSNYEGDKSFYLLLAKNLGDGHGLTIPVTLLSNPSVTDQVYLPSGNSPLYSIIAVPLLKLFPDNYLFVTWLIESLSWLLLFIIIHRILRQIVDGFFWPNLTVLFCGFFIYNIEQSSPSKDILATAFIFLGLLCCIRIGQAKSPRSITNLSLVSFIFILPGLTKFMYLPLAIVFPLAIIFCGFLSKRKFLTQAGTITLLICGLLVTAHYFYFHWLESRSVNLHGDFYSNRWSLSKSGDEFKAGFYPQNLLLLYPYIPAAIINLDMIGVQVRAYVNSMYQAYGITLSILNFIGIAGWAIAFYYTCRNYYRTALPPRILFTVCGTVLSFSLILLTSAFSIRYHTIEYKGSGSTWTYIFENRPFIYSIILIQLLLVSFLFSKKPRKVWLSRIRLFLFVVMSVGFIHGIYFLIKTSLDPRITINKRGSINQMVIKEADSLKQANPSYQVWIASEMQHLDWYAKLQGHKVMNHVAWLNDSTYKLPPKTILITALSNEDTTRISKYLQREGVHELRNFKNTWYLYLQKPVETY